MIAIIVLAIMVAITLVVFFVYFWVIRLANQCNLNPSIWCYNDWTCEVGPDKIGDIDCNGNCKQAIIDFLKNPTGCSNGCNDPRCQCRWSTEVVPNPEAEMQSNGTSFCSTSKYPGVSIGRYICGGAEDLCPSGPEPPCNPYCIDQSEPNCC
jgi:hypothetical protein